MIPERRGISGKAPKECFEVTYGSTWPNQGMISKRSGDSRKTHATSRISSTRQKSTAKAADGAANVSGREPVKKEAGN